MQQQTTLFATFINKNTLGKTLKYLKENYKIFNNMVYILNNKNDRSQRILTYNIELEKDEEGKFIQVEFDSYTKNTVNIHRRKLTNTLYTINALNILLSEHFDKNSNEIKWDDFSNCLLLTKAADDNNPNAKSLVIINTGLNSKADLNYIEKRKDQN